MSARSRLRRRQRAHIFLYTIVSSGSVDTDEEFAALQEVGKGLTQRIIPTEQRDVLIALRYIKSRVLVVSR